MVLYLSDSDVTMVILLSVVAMCWCGAVVKICEYSSVVLFNVHIYHISDQTATISSCTCICPFQCHLLQQTHIRHMLHDVDHMYVLGN